MKLNVYDVSHRLTASDSSSSQFRYLSNQCSGHLHFTQYVYCIVDVHCFINIPNSIYCIFNLNIRTRAYIRVERYRIEVDLKRQRFVYFRFVSILTHRHRWKYMEDIIIFSRTWLRSEWMFRHFFVTLGNCYWLVARNNLAPFLSHTRSPTHIKKASFATNLCSTTTGASHGWCTVLTGGSLG